MSTLLRPMHQLTCRTCGAGFESRDKWRVSCSPACFAPTARRRKPQFHHPAHTARLKAAPGMSDEERKALRARWVKQGRLCVYCRSRKATTLDHVIPLRHGGTNHEGNLAPACLSCNSRKSSLYVIEVKAGRLTPAQAQFRRRKPA